jgi:ligand-binding sensor domain-containing protein
MNDPDNKNSLLSNTIISLFVDDLDTIWIGTAEGLCSFNSETESFTRYQTNPEYPETISNSAVYTIYEDSDHNIWFGTYTDVYTLDNKTGYVTPAIFNSEFTGNQDEVIVNAMYQDSNKTLWIAKGYGLYSYDIKNKELESYYLGESISHDLILDILEDNNGDIWFSTRQGLWRLSLENGNYTKYGENDGLDDEVFCDGASYITEEGELFFGTLNGIVSFSPNNITQNTSLPIVLINGFELLDKNISFEQSIEDIEEIILSYADNSFVLDFTAIEYNSPENIK